MDVYERAQDALAEICWCGHPYWNHTDDDTPICCYPNAPDESLNYGPDLPSLCKCRDWWPMDEPPPGDE